MNGITQRIIGWVLIGIGVAMIFWTISVSYNIFTGAREAPKIFKIESQQQTEQCPAAASASQSQQLQAMQEEVKKIVEGQLKNQIKEFFPPEFIAKIFNLGAWGIFAWLIFLAGSRIAGIGMKLINIKSVKE
ncbi:MAG: hypothetical protein UT31_C0029G0010 [Parcubacteria group bacterium GW2011_GWF2_39_13b]|nr:MAG: hypothetical protein UT31_C0029G0010 [Parcubacteria group bacterium GW2011_GWF2_39_13b]